MQAPGRRVYEDGRMFRARTSPHVGGLCCAGKATSVTASEKEIVPVALCAATLCCNAALPLAADLTRLRQ